MAAFAVLVALLFSPALGGSQVIAKQTADGWSVLTPGVDYREFTLPGPVKAYVARMAIKDDPDDPLDITLESGIAGGRLGATETVRGIAARYDDAIDYWGPGWGNRSDILVAINGSYFGKTDTPENGMVQSGWYAKQFEDLSGGSGLVWTMDRQVFIGDCVTHRSNKQVLHVADDTGAGIQISGINTARTNDDLILYTPQYGIQTPEQTTGVEVVVQLTRPLLILPYSIDNPGAAVIGKVIQIRNAAGSTRIPFDALVLSAGENRKDTLLANLTVGSTVRVNLEITSLSRDCQTGVDLPWTKAYTSLGAALHLLESGAIFPPAEDTTRAPRSAIAYDANYIYLIVVDGRQPDYSIGMTFQELALFIRDTLGAPDAVAQDGGGSSTMVVNGRVVNRPSNVCYYSFLPLVTSSGGTNLPSARALKLEERFEPVSRLPYGCERRVANALMIAKVSPKILSTTSFSGSDLVFTTTDAVLRSGPGTNYAGLAVISAGSYGVLNDEPAFNGIYAKGSYWWKVTFSGKTGWIAENTIATLAPRLSFWNRQR